MHVITIRPEPASSETVANGAAQGLAISAFPLSSIEPRAWQGPDPAEVDGLLAGSMNAFRHGGEELARYHGKPVLAVGPTTAKAAREAGFEVELVGEGGLQKLLDQMDERPLRLLRLAGERHVDLAPPDGVTVEMCITYAACDCEMPPKLVETLQAGDALVLLHSAGAATHFRNECERLGIEKGGIALAALGPRIADAAGSGWGKLRSAQRPAAGALLALAKEMCQKAD
ncbi:uroporphyrinogen-III synthase [Alteraurantiacibacter aquimixticola]|uniref:Uroporphyrinogen-III synthase n=1 Tax=Alteraurantiacibacter aquimixticola TaxID=2489173 RepID=A0A4T3F0L7_9SPHN|nr:uroporphyrinogen-III synthase [Alteraurantiacibacter aquimixticola]TIX50611.1 uroporphyrinogen-III synthase [Alteraurantiacibacter aquimixticola]